MVLEVERVKAQAARLVRLPEGLDAPSQDVDGAHRGLRRHRPRAEEGRLAVDVDALGHAVVDRGGDARGVDRGAAGPRALVAPAPLDALQARDAAGLGDLHRRRRPRRRERRPRADLDDALAADERLRPDVARLVGLAQQPDQGLRRGLRRRGGHRLAGHVEAVLRDDRHRPGPEPRR